MKPIILLIVVSLFAFKLHAGGPAKKPNIVFMLVDDLGSADIGAYGPKTIHTPTLDELASEGKKFTQHYAGCPVLNL